MHGRNVRDHVRVLNGLRQLVDLVPQLRVAVALKICELMPVLKGLIEETLFCWNDAPGHCLEKTPVLRPTMGH